MRLLRIHHLPHHTSPATQQSGNSQYSELTAYHLTPKQPPHRARPDNDAPSATIPTAPDSQHPIIVSLHHHLRPAPQFNSAQQPSWPYISIEAYIPTRRNRLRSVPSASFPYASYAGQARGERRCSAYSDVITHYTGRRGCIGSCKTLWDVDADAAWKYVRTLLAYLIPNTFLCTARFRISLSILEVWCSTMLAELLG
jgi:hypothetical protein